MIDENGLCAAPWTDEEVESLNGYQQSGAMHPFTGGERPGGRPVLVATRGGWIEEPGGPVVQTWAHRFMADGSWRVLASALRL